MKFNFRSELESLDGLRERIVEVEFEKESLDDIFSELIYFLRANGYQIDDEMKSDILGSL